MHVIHSQSYANKYYYEHIYLQTKAYTAEPFFGWANVDERVKSLFRMLCAYPAICVKTNKQYVHVIACIMYVSEWVRVRACERDARDQEKMSLWIRAESVFKHLLFLCCSDNWYKINMISNWTHHFFHFRKKHTKLALNF